MEDKLSAFREEEENGVSQGTATRELELLVLGQGTLLLGVVAASVDSVVPWSDPVPIPESPSHALGVVQDRGRLVVVTKPIVPDAKTLRLVVCVSSAGLVGIPATTTRSVGQVTVLSAYAVGEPVMTNDGTITILDIEGIAQSMLGEG